VTAAVGPVGGPPLAGVGPDPSASSEAVSSEAVSSEAASSEAASSEAASSEAVSSEAASSEAASSEAASSEAASSEAASSEAASSEAASSEAASSEAVSSESQSESVSEPESEPFPGPPAGPGPAVPQFSVALVSAVTVDLPNQHPTVVLREAESPRRQLSFSIGLQDGVVLSHAVRRITTPRPLTPELMSGVLQGFDIDIVAVRIVGRQGGVYFAELDLRGRTGRSVHSCRPSDGLTLALLQPVQAPILIDRRLLETAADVAPG
jgi:bifunctional DNase/RNase